MTIQTSLQALRVYQKALKDPAAELKVTSGGNVRIATLFDRAINRIADLFRSQPAEQRREQARQAIREKFQSEIQLLGRPLSTPQRQVMDGAMEMLIAGQDVAQDVEQVISRLSTPRLSVAMRHIRDVSDIDSDKLGVAWQAMTELVSDGHHAPDASFARRVAELSQRWEKDLHLGKGEAYRMAYNAAALYKRYGIDADDARDILQTSGRLRQRHGMSGNEALQFAIDLHVPMQKAGVRIDSLERMLKPLQMALPTLANYELRTRFSVALCYLQLQDPSSGVDRPIDEVKERLSELKVLQGVMPQGCKIDQIHQGGHVRGRAELGTAGLQALETRVSTLADYPHFDGSAFKAVLPDAYRMFELQFVKDLVRGYEFEWRHNGHPDADFVPVESRRRAAPGKLSEQDYAEWASHYERMAGSEAAASTLSHLQSQNIFGDIEEITATGMINVEGYTIKASGDEKSTRMQFVADRRTVNGAARIDLRTTQSVDANILLADPLSVAHADLPRAQVQVPLLPASHWLPDMRQPGAALVRDFSATIPLDALDAGSTACEVRHVTETWDLVPDWDTWMQQRAATL